VTTTVEVMRRTVREYLIECATEEASAADVTQVLCLGLGLRADESDVATSLDLLIEAQWAESDPDGYYRVCADGDVIPPPQARTDWSLNRATALRTDVETVIGKVVGA
jgi:hypothetical protein